MIDYIRDGQEIYRNSFAIIRAEANLDKIPADLAATLPDTTGAVFPTLDQLNKATQLITKNWDSVVGADVK